MWRTRIYYIVTIIWAAVPTTAQSWTTTAKLQYMKHTHTHTRTRITCLQLFLFSHWQQTGKPQSVGALHLPSDDFNRLNPLQSWQRLSSFKESFIAINDVRTSVNHYMSYLCSIKVKIIVGLSGLLVEAHIWKCKQGSPWISVKTEWKILSHLLASAQLPSVFDNVLQESGASFSPPTLIVTFNRLHCGKLPRKSSHIA